MASRSGLFSSSVGTKILIGITGVALVLYLLIHIAGNMVVFLASDLASEVSGQSFNVNGGQIMH